MPNEEKPSCAWCGRKVLEFTVPRCRRCDLVMCSPYLRDCAFEHWADRHLGKKLRRVEDVPTREAL